MRTLSLQRISFLALFFASFLYTQGCATPSTQEILSTEAQLALKDTLFDEFKAEATYKKVLQKFNQAQPFSNIIHAETTHASSLLKMYTLYHLQSPTNPWATSLDGIPAFETLQDACKAGAQAEIENIALYDRYLREDLPAQLRTVFTSLRDASQTKHLPAFQACANESPKRPSLHCVGTGTKRCSR